MLRQYLTEHVVINSEEVDAWAKKWMFRLQTQESRTWIYKRVRSWVLNDASMLRAIKTHDIAPDAPGFVRAAVDRGEQVYIWDPQDDQPVVTFVDRLNHIQDFLTSVEETVGLVPTNPIQTQQVAQAKKILSKLSKMTIEQAEQMAEQWAKLAGAGLKRGKTKEGVIVMHEWADGMYAVRYTDPKVMQRDGHDLQNCLRQGTYWDQVQRGLQWVVAIRKPNDEAVVGMRWSLPEPHKVIECKGKQNMPVTPAYVPYVVDLLKAMKVDGTNNDDLRSAGIEYHDGQYGTFRDIADKFTFDGVTIWKSNSAFEAEVRGQRGIVSGRIAGNPALVSSLDIPREYPDSAMIGILNGLNRTRLLFGEGVLQNLVNNYAIFQGQSGFGTAESVGLALGEFPSDGGNGKAKFFSTLGRDRSGYLVMINGDRSYLCYASTGKLRTFNEDIIRYVDRDDVVEAVNRAGLAAEAAMENSYFFRWGYVHTPKGWKEIEKVGKPMKAERAGIEPFTLWNYDDKVFLYEVPGTDGYGSIRKNHLELESGYHDDGDMAMERGAMNLLIRTFKIKDCGGQHGMCGAVKTKTDLLIADPETLVKLIEAHVANETMNTGNMYDVRRDLGGMLESAAWHNGVDQALSNGVFLDMTVAQATRIFNALNPMKLKEPILFNKSKMRAMYGIQHQDVYVFIPTPLAMFEKLWEIHPKLNERYVKILEAMNEYGLKRIESMPSCHFLLSSSSISMNTEFHRKLSPLFKKIVEIGSACKKSFEDAARNPPADAPATSRYQAINTLRDMNKR